MTDQPNKDEWYEGTKKYWENTEISVKGVLGGNDQVHDIDVKVSCDLLDSLIKQNLVFPFKVLDVGAGIGRVTSNVLQKYFSEIDLVEQNHKYVDYCKDYFKFNKKVNNIYKSSIQDFIFKTKYNVIWIQWCLENIDDDDLVSFLKKCKENLETNGTIIVKENIISKGTKFWEEDYSKIRSDIVFKQIFLRSGLKVKKHIHHPNWPKDLLMVSIFLLTI